MNSPHALNRKSFLLSLIFIILLLLISGSMSLYLLTDKSIGQAITLVRAVLKIDENYFEAVDHKQMAVSAREAIFDRLDRYSSYYQKQRFEQMDDEMSGSYSGIGVSIIEHEKGLLIMSVREDGPAATAGILTGDIIISVNSQLLEGLDALESISILKGEEDTAVELEILRPVKDLSFKIKLVRKRLDFIHIPFAGYTADSLLYIRLLDFDAGASDDLKDVLDSLVVKKDVKPKGIILDMRGNPGGLFHEAYRAADLFLGKNKFIVGTDGRSRWNEVNYYSTGEDITDNLPMAVIVNRGSASSAEIVSGALQQADRAFLVGDTTFGKGLVQGFVRFPDGDGLKLTMSRYYFEGGIFLNEFDSTLVDTGHGLVPDYYFHDRLDNYFIIELENSLVLQDFSSLYQEEIIEAVRNDVFDDIWIEKLIEHIQKRDKTIKSKRTELAENLKNLFEEEMGPGISKNAVNKIISLSRSDDYRKFYKYRDYIKYRLSRLAFQRKYGTYQMYKEIVLNQQPIIKYASQLVLEN